MDWIETFNALPWYGALAVVTLFTLGVLRAWLPTRVEIWNARVEKLRQDNARDQQEFLQSEQRHAGTMRLLELSEQTVAAAQKNAEAGQKNAEMAQKTLEEQALVFKRDRALMEEKLAGAVKEINDLKAAAVEQEKKTARVEQSNAELVKANAEIEAAMKDLTRKYKDNQDTLTIQAQTLGKQADQIEKLEKEVETLTAENIQLKAENESMATQLKKLSDKTDGLDKDKAA